MNSDCCINGRVCLYACSDPSVIAAQLIPHPLRYGLPPSSWHCNLEQITYAFTLVAMVVVMKKNESGAGMLF